MIKSTNFWLEVFKKLGLGMMSIAFTILPAFSQQKDPYPLPANPLQGASVFIEKGCIECHKIWDVGEPFGPDLTQIGAKKDFFELAGSLWSHSPKMVGVMEEKGIDRPVFSPEETEALLAYIYYLGFFDEKGDFLKGEEIFEDKNCSHCHSLGGGPAKSGPSLDKYGRFVSPVYISTALWNHSASVSQAMMAQSFGAQEMVHLLAFIKGNAINENAQTTYIQPGNPQRGKEVFREKKCISCHDQRGFDLKESDLRKSLTEIVGMMWTHSYPMWEEMRSKGMRIPRFNETEMSDLTAYLYFVGYYGQQGNAAKGKMVFDEKGCISCHSQEAVERGAGINMQDVADLSFFELISVMWNHVPEMEKMVTELNLLWPRFEAEEMKSLILYIQSLR